MRYKKIKEIRKKLKAGKASIGSWMQIPHSSIAEIMGQAGYDWVALDLEHGSISVDKLPDLFRALELGGTLPLARLAQGYPKDCKQVLDAGAGGVIVPMVESAETLQQVRDSCCWPPTGNRGVGFSRANLFGKHFIDYNDEAQGPLLVAQIEHIRAVDNMERILAVSGLDAIIIGPYDLSASMDLTAKFDHEDYKKALQKILDVAQKFNMPAGVHVVEPDRDELRQRLTEGYRFIAYSTDAMFLIGGAEIHMDETFE